MTRFAIARPGFLDDPGLGAVWDALAAARLVGGSVRDALAGLPVADFDFATPLPPGAVMAALRAAGMEAVPTGIAHGTVTAVHAGRGFEITTLRRDVATDGRWAEVVFTEEWAADAARRDFTINAMSMTRDAVVEDFFGGRADLAAGILRFVGDPATRLSEDWLRALRYFRFYARYAALPPDAATEAALRQASLHVHTLSAERVWSELQRILAAPDPVASLHLMRATKVLGAVLPEAGDLERLAALVRMGAPADPLLRLASLLRDPAAVAARLKLSRAEAAYLAALLAAPGPVDADDDALRRLLAEAGREVAVGRAWLAGAPDAVRARLNSLAVPVFPLEGRDLLAAGYAPGPAVGAALAGLRRHWLAEGCRPDRAALLALLPPPVAGAAQSN